MIGHKQRILITIVLVSLGIALLSTIVLSVEVAKIVVDRRSEHRIANQTKVQVCFSNQAQVPAQRGILLALEDVVQNAITTTEQVITTSPGDPSNAARRASIIRYQEGKARLSDYLSQLKSNSPTKQDCINLAKLLGVSR